MAANPSNYWDPEFGNPYDPDISNPVKIDRYEKWKRGELGYNPTVQSPASNVQSPNMSNFSNMVAEAQKMTQANIQPQVQSLEAQKPLIEQRYQNLLGEVTGATRTAAANEFSRRGIPLSSGLVEQSVGKQLAPQIAQAGQIRETSLADLASIIAQLESGALGQGTDIASTLYGYQQQAQESAANRALQQLLQEQSLNAQQQQQAAQLAWEQQQAQWEQPWQEKLWNYQLNQPYYKPTTMTTGSAITAFPDMTGGTKNPYASSAALLYGNR